MSINMSNVKAITLGGQNVKKIENSQGIILWQKPGEGSLKTINAYYIRVYYYNEYYLRKEQLTTKVACATEENGTKFFLLTLNEFNAIKNGTYSGATAGHTIYEWVNKTYELYWCYFNDNYEIYLVGDSRNSTANDTVLGTTNDSTYAKRYYCFQSGSYYYVNLVDNSSTSSNVTRWRVTSATYWVNHTNKVRITDKNTFSFSSTTITVQPFYIKHGNYYMNRQATLFVTASNTAETVWYLDDDNRIYCLDGTEKYYLQCKTWGAYNVYVGTVLSTENDWLYKNGNYITGTINGTTYYLYRYGSGYEGVRMRTTATTLTFEPVSS